MHNVQEMSAALNGSTQALEQLVEKVSDFSGETLEQVAFFRNQLAGLLANAISLWRGVKAGWSSFVSREPTRLKSLLSGENIALLVRKGILVVIIKRYFLRIVQPY